MSCPTCDATMQRVNEGVNPKVWWCPRCGSIKSEPGVPECETPKIVERAKSLCRGMRDFRTSADDLALALRTLEESVLLPDDRPSREEAKT